METDNPFTVTECRKNKKVAGHMVPITQMPTEVKNDLVVPLDV